VPRTNLESVMSQDVLPSAPINPSPSGEVPLVVEGRVHTPAQAALAMEHGAFAVVVGTAVTHPTTIASWFVQAIAAR